MSRQKIDKIKIVSESHFHYHHHNQAEGLDSGYTTISARNFAVLNLYARLSFRFLPPEMTFHWVREDE